MSAVFIVESRAIATEGRLVPVDATQWKVVVGGSEARINVTPPKREAEWTTFIERADLLKLLQIELPANRTKSFQEVQFSRFRSGTRLNSFKLLVTKVQLRLDAWAAISKSIGPINCPFFSKRARIVP